MHGNRGDDDWPELKRNPRQRSKSNLKPLDGLDVRRTNLDEDGDDLQKIKKDRADKHLRNVQNMLHGMATYQNKK